MRYSGVRSFLILSSLLLTANSALANVGVSGGIQLTPFAGYVLGLDYKWNPSLLLTTGLGAGRIRLGSEKGEVRDFSLGAKYFPTEGSFYTLLGMNMTKFEFHDSDPSTHEHRARLESESDINALSIELAIGNRWDIYEKLSIDAQLVSGRIGVAQYSEKSTFVGGEKETTEDRRGQYWRLGLLKVQIGYWL